MPDLVFPTLDPQTTDTERLLLAKQLALLGGGTGTLPAGTVLFPAFRAPRKVNLAALTTRTATLTVPNIDCAGFRSALFEIQMDSAGTGWTGIVQLQGAVELMRSGRIVNWSGLINTAPTSYRISLGAGTKELLSDTSVMSTLDGTTRMVASPHPVPPLIQISVTPGDATSATYAINLWLY